MSAPRSSPASASATLKRPHTSLEPSSEQPHDGGACSHEKEEDGIRTVAKRARIAEPVHSVATQLPQAQQQAQTKQHDASSAVSGAEVVPAPNVLAERLVTGDDTLPVDAFAVTHALHDVVPVTLASTSIDAVPQREAHSNAASLAAPTAHVASHHVSSLARACPSPLLAASPLPALADLLSLDLPHLAVDACQVQEHGLEESDEDEEATHTPRTEAENASIDDASLHMHDHGMDDNATQTSSLFGADGSVSSGNDSVRTVPDDDIRTSAAARRRASELFTEAADEWNEFFPNVSFPRVAQTTSQSPFVENQHADEEVIRQQTVAVVVAAPAVSMPSTDAFFAGALMHLYRRPSCRNDFFALHQEGADLCEQWEDGPVSMVDHETGW